MNLYRIIPDTFTINVGNNTDILGNLNFTGFEDLYYKMGYTSFKKNTSLNNPVNQNYINSFSYASQSKFFFFYPENAIFAANQIVQNKNLYCCNYVLVEYDFPIEVISKYIGIGKYFDNERYLEFLIPKTDFSSSGECITSLKEKEKLFTLSLMNSFNLLNEQIKDRDKLLDSIYVIEILYEYKNFFRESKNISLTDMYRAFLGSDDDIIKSPYLTGRFAHIDSIDIYNIMQDKNSMIFFLSEKGFQVDKSILKPDRYYEENLIDQIDFLDNVSIQKTLLKERKQVN